MGEIVHLQVGLCGNNIGCKFWESISQEHGLNHEGYYIGGNDNQLKQINVYFKESSGGLYIPRVILTDLKPDTRDSVRTADLFNRLSTDSLVFGNNGDGANNIWAKGYYTDGAELVDSIMDVTRKEAEACDFLQGFQLMHSLGGGTGSGMGSLLIKRIKEEYPDRIMTTYSVVPSPKVSDTKVEPYNAVLSLNHLINEADQCFILDNEALYDMCFGTMKISTPNYNDLNVMITAAITGATCPLRFPSQVSGDLQSLSTNMIPFPRLHFFLMGYAPLTSLRSQGYRARTLPELTREMFHVSNVMCAANPSTGKYFACTMMFRGSISSNEVAAAVQTMSYQNSRNFVEWNPDKIKATVCDIPPSHSKMSSMFIANSTCIKNVWFRIADEFERSFRFKAFLHWYTAEGMDEMEFNEASSNLNDLISEYNHFEEEEQINADDDDLGDY